METDDQVVTVGGPPFKVTVSGEGVSVDRTVSQETALSVIAIIMGRTATEPKRGSAPITATRAGVGTHVPESAGEYLAESKAKRHPEKILALGAFLTETGRQTFTSDEVKAQFPMAGEPVPANFPRDFAWAVRIRWIAESPGMGGHYYVTKTGLEAVQRRFPDDVRKATRQAGTGRRRARKKPNAEEGNA